MMKPRLPQMQEFTKATSFMTSVERVGQARELFLATLRKKKDTDGKLMGAKGSEGL